MLSFNATSCRDRTADFTAAAERILRERVSFSLADVRLETNQNSSLAGLTIRWPTAGSLNNVPTVPSRRCDSGGYICTFAGARRYSSCH